MFIGRKKELKKLNAMYESEKFQFIVMYGRRRVGKTTLINEFCKGKKSLYIAGEAFNERSNLENFTRATMECFNLPTNMPAFTDYNSLFNFILTQNGNNQLVLVMDEFQYLADVSKGLLSKLQNLIDQKLKETKLFIIVCGSSLSFMENEVLAYKSPLFGRRTGQFIIEPLDFYNAIQFFPSYCIEDKIIAYSILGGTPQYLQKFSDCKSIKENLIHHLFDKSSYLYDEARNIIRQEFREVSTYNGIIQAVAAGYTKINQIATKIGEPTDKVSKYIKALIELRLLERQVPFGESEKSRKSIYKICDNYLDFYYRFVYKNDHLIQRERLNTLYEYEVLPYLNTYIGKHFENVCITFMLRENDRTNKPFTLLDIGNWWGSNKATKGQEEIDIVAKGKYGFIFGECKWRNEKIKRSVYEDLKRKSALIGSSNDVKYYWLFSKSGFEKSLIDLAEKDDKIRLIHPREMM